MISTELAEVAMLVILTPGRLKQEGHEFKANLGYTARSCFTTETNTITDIKPKGLEQLCDAGAVEGWTDK